MDSEYHLLPGPCRLRGYPACADRKENDQTDTVRVANDELMFEGRLCFILGYRLRSLRKMDIKTDILCAR